MNIFNAINNNDLKQVKANLKKNSDIVNKRRDGEYPLHIAAEQGKLDIVGLLLEHHAKVDVKDSNGWTPLFLACGNGYFDVMLELLDHGADPTQKCRFNDTPLHFACRRGGNIKIVQYLFNYHIEIDAQNIDGWTPLHRASYSNNSDAVMLLISEGADTSILTTSGKTAFDLALSLRSYDLAEIIKRYGAIQQRNRKKEDFVTIQLGEVSHVVEYNNDSNANSIKQFLKEKKEQVSNIIKRQRSSDTATQQEQEARSPVMENTHAKFKESLKKTQEKIKECKLAISTEGENLYKNGSELTSKIFNKNQAGNTLALPPAEKNNDKGDKKTIDETADENQLVEHEAENKPAAEKEEEEDGVANSRDDEHECPVCFEVPLPPVHIYQCTNGHLYCGNCKVMPNMTKCPQCSINITGLANRNRYAEENIAKLYAKK